MNQTFETNLEKAPEFKDPKQEIEFLRGQLEKQSKVLASHENLANKREEIAESIVTSYKQTPVEEVIHPTLHVQEEEHKAIQLQLSPEQHDDLIGRLYNLMLEKGIKNTLEIVARMNNPHVEDDFHRFLVQYLAEHYEVPGLKPKTNLSKSLGLRMFEIILPTKRGEEKQNFKEISAQMEQFMAGMQSIAANHKNVEKYYYTLELSLAENSDDMSMYVTVPEFRSDLFEKQILSLFEDVRVTEIHDDYNIFSYNGISSGCYAKSTDHEVLQIKTYDDFEHDPMKVIVNAFSKLASSGEGASIQIVVVPNGDTHIKEYGSVLDRLKKGEKLKSAVDTSFGKHFAKEVGTMFSTKKESEMPDKEIDNDAIESVGEKLKSTILQTNVRIVASAESKNRSLEILHDLESAFQQFNNTKGNGVTFQREEGYKLDDLVHEFIFRLFNDRQSFRLNIKELATIYHFPLDITGSSALKQTSSKTAPAPETSDNGVILGTNSYRHMEKTIRMSPEDRLRHFYVIGQTGTGKTHILKSMVIQDIINGDGVCFMDPHGSDLQDILDHIPPDRVKDVIYFDPSNTSRPMGLNMLEYDIRFPEQKSFVINEMMLIFTKLFDMSSGGGGPMFEQYFRNSAGLVMEHPDSGNTLLEIGRVLADKEFRDLKLSYCNNPIIKQFWQNAEKTTGDQGLENFVPYITSKFDVFISNEIMRPIIAQPHSAFNMRDIMDNKKILLVNLSKGKLGEINSNLIGLILVGKILMAALSRVDSIGVDLPPFYLYIDEFQNVTTNSISQILSEARKYGLGLHIAHQFIAQIDEGIKDAIFGNVGSVAAFRVSTEDAEYLEKRFTPTFTADDLSKIESRNAYVQILSNGKPLTPFNVKPPPLGKSNPPGVTEKIKELSSLKYGKEREIVEKEILSRYTQ